MHTVAMGRPLRSSNLQPVSSPAKRKLPSSSENTDSSSTDSKESLTMHCKLDRKALRDKTNKKSSPSPAKRTRLRARLPMDQEVTLSTDSSTKPPQLSDSPAESVKINRRAVKTVKSSNIVPQVDNTRKTRRAILTTNAKSSKHQSAIEEHDEDEDIPVAIKKTRGSKSDDKNSKPDGRYVKNTTGNLKDKFDSQVPKVHSSVLDEAPLKNTQIRASVRKTRTASLKENERDEETSSDDVDKKNFVMKKQFRRVNRKEILASINDSSSSSSSDDDSPVRKIPICHSNSTTPVKKAEAFKVSTFYGDSKPKSSLKEKSSPAASEGKERKGCVYKTREEEKPLAIKPRTETERLALYEFEFDSNEEKPKKKKRKPRPTKPKQVTKKLPLPKKQGGRKVMSPVHEVYDFLPLSSNIKAPCFPMKNLTKAPVNNTRAGLKVTDPPPAKKPQPSVSQASVPVLEPPVKPTTPRQRRSLSLPKPRISKPAPVDPIPTPEPPLLSLFDDCDDIPSLSVSNIPQHKLLKTKNSEPKSPVSIGPIRFEYEELAQARARVLRNSLTPKASHSPLKPVFSKPNSPQKSDTSTYDMPVADDTLPAAESSNGSDSCQSMPRLRQTSIRAFLHGKQDEEDRVDDKGLFSTGTRSAVEDMPAIEEISRDNILNHPMVSSTPQRPDKARPPLASLLSPVMASPVLRVSPRSSPRKVMETPEKLKPSPQKIAQSPVRASLRKLVVSPKKDSPKPMPTRISIGTLRSVFRANVQPAPPMMAPLGDEEVPEDRSTQQVPVSPQRNFNKVCRI